MPEPMNMEPIVKKCSILLIDDDEVFRSGIKKLLYSRGYSVVEAAGVKEALRSVRDFRYEVIIVDTGLSRQNHGRLVQGLKKYNPNSQLIMLTTPGEADSKERYGQGYIFKFVQKPCGIEDLVRDIEEARRLRRYTLARNEEDGDSDNIVRFLTGRDVALIAAAVMLAIAAAAAFFLVH